MLTLHCIIQSVQQGDWIAMLDQKDAYFHAVIHPWHRRFLQFWGR